MNASENQDLTPEELEFGKHAGDSSKDNFLVWMTDQVEQIQERFRWSAEEVAAVSLLVMATRDNGIEDLLSCIEDLRGLRGLEVEARRSDDRSDLAV